MTRQEAMQEQIDEIMDTFDFQKAHKMMLAVGSTWGDEGTPEEYELRARAREFLKQAAKDGYACTGGFTALLEEGVEDGKPWVRMSLAFGQNTFNDGTFYEK